MTEALRTQAVTAPLQELEAVCEGVVGVDASEAREVGIPGDRLPGGGEAGDDLVEVVDKDARVGLAGGPELVVDAEVQLDAAGAKPGAAARRQGRGLRDLNHAQDADVEGSGGGLPA
jgi:hypothetical protein